MTRNSWQTTEIDRKKGGTFHKWQTKHKWAYLEVGNCFGSEYHPLWRAAPSILGVRKGAVFDVMWSDKGESLAGSYEYEAVAFHQSNLTVHSCRVLPCEPTISGDKKRV